MDISTPASAAVRVSEFERLLRAVRDSATLNEQSNAVVVSGKLWRRIADTLADDTPHFRMSYDDWKTRNPDDDRCEFCGVHPRECRAGWQPNSCTGECGQSWRDPDYEYEKMRDEDR